MKARIFVAALACMLAAGTAARASYWHLPWMETTLTDQDIEILGDTVRQQIHGKKAGTVARWSNPANGHSGTATLLGTSTRQGMPCEKIEYRVASAQPGEHPERYVFNSCRLPDGTWKLAE